jgi:hypothetical protein
MERSEIRESCRVDADPDFTAFHPGYACSRHCERSEAIQYGGAALDCFVAALLAMKAG